MPLPGILIDSTTCLRGQLAAGFVRNQMFERRLPQATWLSNFELDPTLQAFLEDMGFQITTPVFNAPFESNFTSKVAVFDYSGSSNEPSHAAQQTMREHRARGGAFYRPGNWGSTAVSPGWPELPVLILQVTFTKQYFGYAFPEGASVDHIVEANVLTTTTIRDGSRWQLFPAPGLSGIVPANPFSARGVFRAELSADNDRVCRVLSTTGLLSSNPQLLREMIAWLVADIYDPTRD